jgi:hypothetical protein
MAIYPYTGSGYDKYWKYENKDPSNNHYATAVALEILSEIQDKISKRGKCIYGVRPEAIIVQDLRHETIRQLAQMLNEHVKEIEKYERENSGDISNYFGSEEEEEKQKQEEDKEAEGNEQEEEQEDNEE